MHRFDELVNSCTFSTLAESDEAYLRISKELETSASALLVKNLQMMKLQKVYSSVGLFSIFEARLQEVLDCKNGFAEARKILQDQGELVLKNLFDDLCLAINVLKHGRGRSYDALVAKAEFLPFRVKFPRESFFHEGDVSEVLTLIKVDDAFLQLCAKVISDVSEVIRRAGHRVL